MKRTVTMVYELAPGEVQAWTFDIDESDLAQLAEKYGHTGASTLADAEAIGEEVKEIWK